MSIVFHNDPFTPFDRQPIIAHDSPSFGSGFRRSVAIPHAYLPVPADAARLRVAARSLEIEQWVSHHDADWEPTIEMKQALIQERPDEVVAMLPGAEAACEEVARGVMSSIGVAPTDARGIDALVEAAMCVADDLCVLIPDAEGMPRLVAAVLCSPNRWRLAEKLGGTMASIHVPVARYDIGQATLHEHFAVIDNRNGIANRLDLVHVVTGIENRHSLAAKFDNRVEQKVPRLRIDTHRGLIKQQ